MRANETLGIIILFLKLRQGLAKTQWKLNDLI
jgi:hypothetical protein